MNIKPLLDWMIERQRIYRRRQRGDPPPWTDDPVMRKFHFCNVFRSLDRTTAWLVENWYLPNAMRTSLPFACYLARYGFSVPTLDEIGFPRRWDPARVLRVLRARRAPARRETICTGAFQVWPGLQRRPFEEHAVEILSAVHAARRSWSWQPTLREMCAELTKIRGVGRFTSYQAALDMQLSGWFRPADVDSWCSVQAGSLAGLRMVCPEDVTASGVAKIRDEARRALAHKDIMFRGLAMHDVEHSLCELYKYSRGGAGRRYRPNSESRRIA